MKLKSFKNRFNLLDCTLRDGGYYNNWDFSLSLIKFYIKEISKTNINYIELGFRFLKKNYLMGLTAYTDDKLVNSLNIPKNLNLGVMINASELINNKENSLKYLKKLFPKRNSKIKFVRFACHFNEVFQLKECFNWLEIENIDVFVNIMQISEIEDINILKICKFLKTKKIRAIYLADSLGSLKIKEFSKIITKFKTYWKGDLGLHAHNNLNLALKNSIFAINNHFKWIDCTILGMGRGPGNLKTEEIIKSYHPRDLQLINKIKNKYFIDLHKNFKWGSNKYYALAAKYKIHPTYIQEMLSDKRYKKENYLQIINNLKNIESTKYNINKLFFPNATYLSKGKGEWLPAKDLKLKKILIIGPGKSVERNKEKIEKFIFKNNLFVISVNTSLGISENLINLRAICHPHRIISDVNLHNKSRVNMVMPLSMMPIKLKNLFNIENKFIFDFGLRLNNKKKLLINKNYCNIPSPLAIIYAISVAISGQAKAIYLAGFDGYKKNDPSTDETNFLLKKIISRYNKNPKIKTLTSTNYKIPLFKI